MIDPPRTSTYERPSTQEGNYLVDAVMPSTGWGILHLIPVLPHPNLGLFSSTCLACN